MSREAMTELERMEAATAKLEPVISLLEDIYYGFNTDRMSDEQRRLFEDILLVLDELELIGTQLHQTRDELAKRLREIQQ